MNIDESDSLPGDSETTVVVVAAAAVEVAPALLLNSLPTRLSFVTSVFGSSLIVVVMNRVSLDRGIKSRVLYYFVTPSDTKYMLSSSVHAHTHAHEPVSPWVSALPLFPPSDHLCFSSERARKGERGKERRGRSSFSFP